MIPLAAVLLYILALAGLVSSQPCAQPVTSGLANPTTLVNAGDGSGRLFVSEQPGRVWAVKDNQRTLYLNVTDRVDAPSLFEERGFHGMAFHPQFSDVSSPHVGKLFVMYSFDKAGAHVSRISRFIASTPAATSIDASTEVVFLDVEQPATVNNGGALFFRTDLPAEINYLYATTGDGGVPGDPNSEAQNTSSLLGSVLRLDVSGETVATIPGQVNGHVWAYGFRNPWRCHVNQNDQSEIFCGDVGDDKEEELDLVVSGGNYGWSIVEGDACFNPPTGCDRTGLTAPILTYTHNPSPLIFNSIIGGVVVRSPSLPSLAGRLLFADLAQGFRLLERNTSSPTGWTGADINLTAPTNFILAFGEGEDGEVFISTSEDFSATGGGVYRLTETQACDAATDPDDGDLPSGGDDSSDTTTIVSVSVIVGVAVLVMAAMFVWYKWSQKKDVEYEDHTQLTRVDTAELSMDNQA